MKRINSWQQEMQNWYASNTCLKYVWSCVKDLLSVTLFLLMFKNYKPCNLSIMTPFIRFVTNFIGTTVSFEKVEINMDKFNLMFNFIF